MVGYRGMNNEYNCRDINLKLNTLPRNLMMVYLDISSNFIIEPSLFFSLSQFKTPTRTRSVSEWRAYGTHWDKEYGSISNLKLVHYIGWVSNSSWWSTESSQGSMQFATNAEECRFAEIKFFLYLLFKNDRNPTSTTVIRLIAIRDMSKTWGCPFSSSSLLGCWKNMQDQWFLYAHYLQKGKFLYNVPQTPQAAQPWFEARLSPSSSRHHHHLAWTIKQQRVPCWS